VAVGGAGLILGWPRQETTARKIKSNTKNKIKSSITNKITNNVKGGGQECPPYMGGRR
jgi:hypothetical protein